MWLGHISPSTFCNVEIKKEKRLAFSTKEDIMTVYNINLGIGWASSGVEYAQAYRAQLLRNIHEPAKFVFYGYDPLPIISSI